MKRIHFIEIEDQTWCPKDIRDGVTDFLQYIVRVFGLYKSIVPRITNVIEINRQTHLVDLCSGGAGPWLSLLDDINKKLPEDRAVTVTLTDLYPNQAAFLAAKSLYPKHIDFSKEPVDATRVPERFTGFRTLFSSFHHLTPKQATSVLQDAVDAKTGIAVFESTQRHPLMLIYMLITPVLVWINTPFIRPFSWKRLFWTYVIPLIPLIVMFDGFVSCLRTYTVDELQTMVSNLNDSDDYKWEIGLQRISFLPVGVTFLLGYPVKASELDH